MNFKTYILFTLAATCPATLPFYPYDKEHGIIKVGYGFYCQKQQWGGYQQPQKPLITQIKPLKTLTLGIQEQTAQKRLQVLSNHILGKK